MRISDWSSDVCSSDLDVDHRLDREDHAGLQFGAGAGAAGMDDLGRVVEQAADAVAAEIAHHAVTMRLGMLLDGVADVAERSEEHTSELQSLMRISYAVFCLKKKNNQTTRLTCAD